MKKVYLSLLLCIPVISFADGTDPSTWTDPQGYVCTSNQGASNVNSYCLNYSTMKVFNSNVKNEELKLLWVKYNYTMPIAYGYGKRYVQEVNYALADCTYNLYGVVSATYYDDSQVVGTWNVADPDHIQFNPAAPGTVGAAIIQKACGYQRSA